MRNSDQNPKPDLIREAQSVVGNVPGQATMPQFKIRPMVSKASRIKLYYYLAAALSMGISMRQAFEDLLHEKNKASPEAEDTSDRAIKTILEPFLEGHSLPASIHATLPPEEKVLLMHIERDMDQLDLGELAHRFLAIASMMEADMRMKDHARRYGRDGH